jgi:hypothetical protein
MNRPLQFFEVLEKSGADADKMGRALGHIAYNPNIKNALSLSMLLEYFFKRPVSLAVLNLALTEAAKNPHLPERAYQKMVWRIRTQMKIGLAEKKVLIERLAQARQEATAPY